MIPVVVLAACAPRYPAVDREERIPADAVKVTPASDAFPPILNPDHAGEFEDPVPLDGPVNTAGGEDSPFFDRATGALYFFFTPDVSVPAGAQVGDDVTGIWVAPGDGTVRRVWLAKPKDAALDGCPTVAGDTLWFCSVREGNLREVDVWTATRVDGEWTDVANAGEPINGSHRVGELHVTSDGQTLVYGSDLEGGAGGQDLWMSSRDGASWGPPENLGSPPNSDGDEWYPWVSDDLSEVWFLSGSQRGFQGPALFRSRLEGGAWSEPEEIVSQFAAEPTLDGDGNVYFAHHFFPEGGDMIEADIYVLRRR